MRGITEQTPLLSRCAHVCRSCALIDSLITSTIKCPNSITIRGLSYHVAVLEKRPHECASSSLINSYLEAKKQQMARYLLLCWNSRHETDYICWLIFGRFHAVFNQPIISLQFHQCSIFLMSWLPDRSRLNATAELITLKIYHEAHHPPHWPHGDDRNTLLVADWGPEST